MTNEEVLIRTRFRLDLQPKEAVFTDGIDYTAAGDDINNFSGVIRISGPNGLIYENTDFDDPDIVPGTSRESLKLITLPVDPQNEYQVYDGTYTVKYTIRNNNTLVTYEETFLYGFYYQEPTMVHDVESGPFTATLRSRDLTNYGSNIDTLTRVHRLHYPEGITPSPPADIVTALADYTVDPAYSNLWEITIDTYVLYIQPDGLEYTWTGSIYTEHCVFGSCINDMADVLGVMFDTYIEYTSTNPTKAAQYRERLIKSSTAYSLMEIAWRAGDYQEADKQINIIQDQVRLSGVSSCSQGGASTQVVPCGPWGGSGITPAEYTFSNGITEAAGVVNLGGSLTKDTNIVAGGYHFDISGGTLSHSVQMRIDAVDPHISISADDGSIQGKVTVYENGIDLEYNNLGTPANSRKYSLGSAGLVEDDDYTGSYGPRSLVSKDYVDNNIVPMAVVSDASLTGDGSSGDPLQVTEPFPGFTDLATDYGYTEPVHAFSEITSTPTTIAGYGITDAVENFLGLSDTPSAYTGEGDKFLRVNAAETAIEFSSTTGFVPDTGGTFTGQVTIFTSNDYPLIIQQSGTGETSGVADPSANQIQFQDNDGDPQGYIGIDATGNLVLETNISGQMVQVNGSLDVLGNITLSGTVDGVDISDFKAAYDIHTHAFADITGKPTTLSGYGITDAMLNTAASWATEFIEKTGVTISDRLVIEDVGDTGIKKYVTVGNLPGAAATFLALTDTPSSLSGAGDYVVTVNAAMTALEFTDYSGTHISTANGTLNAYTEKVLPTINDVLIIEDAADLYAQKKVLIGNLPASGGGGSGTSLYYRFDNATSKADPTAGRFRFNNATLVSVTEIYLDVLAWNAIDISEIIETIKSGNYLYIQQLDISSHVVVFQATADPVDETGYYTIAVSFVSDGGAGPDNASDCGIMIESSVDEYTFSNSIVNTAGVITLVNDEASPTSNSFYGTGSTGTKGWISFAHGSEHESTGSDTINHDNLIGFVTNEHIDWTADQGATNIHAGNYVESDPTVGSHIKAITATDILNWDTAYGWGDHAGLYDNYGSWNLKTGGVQRIAVVKDGTLDIVGGTGITSTYSAGGVVTLAGTVTQYTNEMAQDAVGGILSNEFTYTDLTPSISLNYTNISHTSLQDIGSNTHAQIDTALIRLVNTSGTNTGDQNLSSYLTSVAFSDIQAGSVLLSTETFSDVDTQLMTAAAIDDLILSKGYIDSETDSQTLSWNDGNGELTITGGNNVDLDGRYLLLTGGTIDGGTNSTLNIISNDDGASTINLSGSSQGTGRLYVGQSSTHGGGIEYNGDNNPSTTGAGSDYVTLWRRSASVDEWTARNRYDSNDWEFRGNITAANLSNTNTGDQDSIAGISGTKAQFNTAVTDGDFLYDGDITQYTDALAVSAVATADDYLLNTTDTLTGDLAVTGTANVGGNGIIIDTGAGYTSQLRSEYLLFSRASGNYIKANTAGGYLSFITNGLATSTANSLLYLTTAEVILRHGSTTPATKLTTTSAGVDITGDLDVTGTVIASENNSVSGEMDTIAYRFVEGRGWGYNRTDDRVFYNGSGVVPFWVDLNDAQFNVDLAVTGDLTVTGDITATDFALSSDPRLKDIESSVTNGLDIIEALNPVNYKWKDGRDDFSHIGFLTTDVEKVRPELVVKGETDSLSYMQFTAINTAAIKELNDQIKALQNQLKQLQDASS